jgi:hypothetical protein
MSLVHRIRNAYRRLKSDNESKDLRIATLEKELAPFRELADELDPPAVETPPETGNGATG